MLDRNKYYLVVDDEEIEVSPLSVNSVTYDDEREDGKIFFRRKMNGEITFIRTGYTIIKNFENTNPCARIEFRVKRYHAGVYELFWTGYFTARDCKYNVDRGTIRVTPKPLDAYTCFDIGGDKEINVLTVSLANPKVTGKHVRNFTAGGLKYSKYVTWNYYHSVDPGTTSCICDSEVIGYPSIPTLADLIWAYDHLIFDNPGRPSDKANFFAENFADCFMGSTMECESNSPVTTIDGTFCVYTVTYRFDVYSYYIGDRPGRAPETENGWLRIPGENEWIRCTNAYNPAEKEYNNCRKLENVIKLFVNNICPGLTYVSDFFSDSTNYVTGTSNKYKNILLSQITDIAYPTDADATICMLTFNSLMETLRTMFNVYWFIDSDGNFRIEHISYINASVGIDTTTDNRYNILLAASNEYEYKSDELPSIEKFYFKDSYHQSFIGKDIFYSGDCVITSGDGKEKKYAAADVITDLLYLEIYPDLAAPKSGGVDSLKGYCLLACDSDNKVYHDAGPGTNIYRPNNILGWANLHNLLHRHGRILINGNMNGVNTTFESAIKIKKQREITIPFFSGVNFNPQDKVITAIGEGFVDSSSIILGRDVIKLNLVY